MTAKRLTWLMALLLTALTGTAIADKDDESKSDDNNESSVRTEHRITIDGNKVPYNATAGTIALRNNKDEQRASVFYVAYERSDIGDKSTRPIIFAFNGGPGSSSVWLHMGVLGPQRVTLDDQGMAPDPPYGYGPNDQSILDRADLVFIDPVSTGYSRPTDQADGDEFHGVVQDFKSIGQFIRLYLTRNQRWQSPKYLVGESYGATRAAFLTSHLHDQYGIDLNGIILVSPAVDFQTIAMAAGNDLPYVLYLPAYAAAAAYHGRVDLKGQDINAFLQDVESFARGDYSDALFAGHSLSPVQRGKVVAELARYTGLDARWLEQADLRPRVGWFAKELLRDQGRHIGRFDARYAARGWQANRPNTEFDPSYEEIYGAFSSAMNDYLRRQLNYETDDEYRIIARDVHPWDYGRYTNRYVNAGPPLAKAMTRIPGLRVMVLQGIYDLATPYYATEYTLQHLPMDPALLDNIQTVRFEAGHMMYTHQPSLLKFRQAVVGFLGE